MQREYPGWVLALGILTGQDEWSKFPYTVYPGFIHSIAFSRKSEQYEIS